MEQEHACRFPRTRRTFILDELLPAALSVSSAATELLPQSAATAEVQPAGGSDLARLPCDASEPVRGPHPTWLERWFQFEEG